MFRKISLLILPLMLLFFFTPSRALAISCKAPRPAFPPVLISAVPANGSVTLTWQEAGDPLTYYLISYGESPTIYEYGVPDVGGRGTTSFTIGQLKNGIKYYFKVMGGNGCKPGEFSNKLSSTPGSDPSKVRLPTLSLLKPTEDVTKSALFNKKPQQKVIGASVKSEKTNTCEKSCNGWAFLGLETAALIFYFYFARRAGFMRPLFSIVIPIIVYLMFLSTNGTCVSINLLCRSFASLNILIFVLLLIFHKRLFLYKS